MNPDAPINLNHHCLLQITPETTDFELEVMRWFADGHEILWIPIYEATDEPTGIADAKAEMAHYGGQRLIRDVTDFCHLPVGIKGWLFPAHLDDTDVVCTRTITGGHFRHTDPSGHWPTVDLPIPYRGRPIRSVIS
ncbi:MAG: hypothetical protein ABTS22_00770 [Accumulibacter sp.]|uniref:hypothetical protein n=1 Tax=Accumulibacter sp. TaxID=2053492 RepID=UPI003314E5DF